MAIEDVIQIKDTAQERIIPFDKRQEVMSAQNQVDFLRFQKERGLSGDDVVQKLIQLFTEEPTRFTQEFGVEAADSIREFLGYGTQGDMEEKGFVFDDNSAEIIGQNISFRPQDSALGTLPTAQSQKFDDSLEEVMTESPKQERKLTLEEIKEHGLSQEDGRVYILDEDTGNIRVDEKTSERRLTQEEVKEYGLPYTDGQIYIMDGETGKITRKEPQGIEKLILNIMDFFKYGHQDPENRDYK
jgi:hypothetical protein